MYCIGVIDDRKEVRQLAKTRIERSLSSMHLEEEWEVLAIPPLASLDDYAGWLAEHEIVVLVLDQRLDESGEVNVPYSGSDILRIVHPRMYDLPVYYFTAVKKDAAVEAGASKVRGILDQQDFFKEPLPWVKEFVREGVRYEQQLARKLGRLGELAEAAAAGEASAEELGEAASLRQELQLPFESASATEEQADASRAELLAALQREVDKLEELATKLEADIARHGGTTPNEA